MADRLAQDRTIRSEAIKRAFGRVPRPAFVPGASIEAAYEDRAIVIKAEGGVTLSSASQPAIVGTMLEQLDVSEGMAVLEVGTGSGYNAALVAEIVGSSGRVVTIEIDPDVAEQARRNLRAIGYQQVHVLVGDAFAGCAEEAPYDRVIVTTGVPDLSLAWIEQLSEGGIIVAPIRLNSLQLSAALVKLDAHRLVSKSLYGCGFSPIRGEWAKAEPPVVLSPEIEKVQRIWQAQRWNEFDDFSVVAERSPNETASRHFTFSVEPR